MKECGVQSFSLEEQRCPRGRFIFQRSLKVAPLIHELGI